MKFSKVIAASIAASAASAAYLKDEKINALYAREDSDSSDGTNTTATSSSTTSADDTAETSSSSDSTSETSSSTEETTSETSSSSEETTSETSTTSEESTSETSETSSTTVETSTSESSETSTSESTSETTTSTHSTTQTSTSVQMTTSASATALPTACAAAPVALSAEDAIKLDIIFGEDVPSERATTYADWLANYLSGLASELNDVSHLALAGGSSDAFTTAFDTVDVAGILDLASAAPMYTCYLSSLWAEALADPSAKAKRAVPTPEEKTKLMVLFEKREQNGVVFNYADILIDETEDLIGEVRDIASAALTATDMSYTSLFTRLNFNFLLSVASEAPIYTEGLSEAFRVGLTSTSPVYNTTMITSTAPPVTSMSYTTRVINGTTTITSCPPESTITVCDIVCQSLKEAASSAARTVTVTSCDTMANGAVQTHYVVNTVCEDVCITYSEKAKSAERTTVVTNYVAGQTENNAVKRAAGFGVGILGFIALLI